MEVRLRPMTKRCILVDWTGPGVSVRGSRPVGVTRAMHMLRGMVRRADLGGRGTGFDTRVILLGLPGRRSTGGAGR